MLGDKDKMTLKVKVKNLIIFVVLLTYLKPFNVSLIPTLNTLYSLTKIIVTFALMLYIIREKFSLTKASKWCLAFLGWWTVAILSNGNLKNNIVKYFRGIIFIQYYAKKIKWDQCYFEILKLYFENIHPFTILHYCGWTSGSG